MIIWNKLFDVSKVEIYILFEWLRMHEYFSLALVLGVLEFAR
jgi:hypothetical protein